MTVTKTEAYFREQLIKTFKKYVGKGPRNAEIKIFKKLLIVSLEDTLTPLEKNILEYSKNYEDVENIRKNISELVILEFKDIIAENIGSRANDYLIKTDLKQDEAYFVFIFPENIEKKINANMRLS